jgi:hypothetical protein
LGIDEARLLLALGAEADEFHAFSSWGGGVLNRRPDGGKPAHAVTAEWAAWPAMLRFCHAVSKSSQGQCFAGAWSVD